MDFFNDIFHNLALLEFYFLNIIYILLYIDFILSIFFQHSNILTRASHHWCLASNIVLVRYDFGLAKRETRARWDVWYPLAGLVQYTWAMLNAVSWNRDSKWPNNLEGQGKRLLYSITVNRIPRCIFGANLFSDTSSNPFQVIVQTRQFS